MTGPVKVPIEERRPRRNREAIDPGDVRGQWPLWTKIALRENPRFPGIFVTEKGRAWSGGTQIVALLMGVTPFLHVFNCTFIQIHGPQARLLGRSNLQVFTELDPTGVTPDLRAGYEITNSHKTKLTFELIEELPGTLREIRIYTDGTVSVQATE